VAGRGGNRKWADEEAVVKVCRSMRLKTEQIYNMKLSSPSQIEKEVGERQWGRLLPHVTKTSGAPTIAPESDRRPTWDPAILDDFESI
jgi:hypothetical protein